MPQPLPAEAGNGCAVFPAFGAEERAEKIHPSTAPMAFQVLSGRQLTKNLFPFLIMCHDFRSNRNQLTVFNRIDDVTELLKIFIVVGCQENCFSLGF